MKTKPQMMLKWANEKDAHPISRAEVARNVRRNRRDPLVKVSRKYGDIYMVSQFLNVGCVIYRAV